MFELLKTPWVDVDKNRLASNRRVWRRPVSRRGATGTYDGSPQGVARRFRAYRWRVLRALRGGLRGHGATCAAGLWAWPRRLSCADGCALRN